MTTQNKNQNPKTKSCSHETYPTNFLSNHSKNTKPTISLSDMLELNQDVHTSEISSC